VTAARQPVVAITGAAGGIGMALATHFATAGYRLALADVDEARLTALAEILRTQDTQVVTSIVDVRQVADLQAWLGQIQEAFQGVDVLINNAGVTTWALFSEMTQADIHWVMDVNVRGVLNGCHVFIPALRQSPKGHIVNISSMIGGFPGPMQTTYTASKWAVRGFSQALRLELRAEGLGVTTVLPGVISTPFLSSARSYDAAHVSRLGDLMKKYGASPDLVARRILRATRRNKGQIRVGIDSHLTGWIQRFLPGVLPWFLGRTYPMLASADRGDTNPKKP
jgi:short-subunit dehydrogenase